MSFFTSVSKCSITIYNFLYLVGGWKFEFSNFLIPKLIAKSNLSFPITCLLLEQMVGLWMLHQATSVQQYMLKNGYELESSLNLSLHLAFVLSVVIICTALFGWYGVFVEGSRMIQMVTICNLQITHYVQH